MRTNATGSAGMSRWLDIVASSAMTAAGLGMLWVALSPAQGSKSAQPAPALPGAPVRIDAAARLGSPSANVVMIMFSDFECPFCGKFANEVLPVLRTDYIDRSSVELVFRHLPLTNIHPNAERAATAADCALEQDRFWGLHDELFKNYRALGERDIGTYAARTGLKIEPFQRCLALGVSDRVKADVEIAKSLAIDSTPLFLVGRRVGAETVEIREIIVGARALTDFRAVLDRWLR